jgi:hypothetical protein
MKRWTLAAVLACICSSVIAVAATLTLELPACASFTLSGSIVTCNAGVVTPPIVSPPTAPPVTTTAGLDRFDNVPGDSDWARWQFWQSSEFVPLQQRLVARGWSSDAAYLRINQQINAYHSTMNVNGLRSGNVYVCFPLGVRTPDVSGACDGWIAAHQPTALPLGPLR